MTVGELIQRLQEFEPEREVYLSQTSEEYEVVDAPVVTVGMMAGVVFVSANDD